MLLSRPLRHAAHGAAALVVIAGSVGMAHYDKAVSISVDGEPASVHVLGSTVSDALDKEGIVLGEHDVVVPSPSTEINDGDHISVRYGRKLTVTVDGATNEYWTTATTVDAALKDLDIRAEGAVLTASRSQPLGRQGLDFAVTTPKKVSVTVDGKTRTVTSVSPKVSGVLGEMNINRNAIDIVKPGLDEAVTDGMKIVMKRVEVKTEKETEKIAFNTTRKNDSSLYTGTTKTVTKGVAGTKVITSEVTYVDGKKSKAKVLSTKTTKKPVTAVVKVGTKERPKAKTSTSSSSSSSSSSSRPPSAPPATPRAPASTCPTRRCGTASPSVSPVATGRSTRVTATTAASSSTPPPGWAPAAATSPPAPTSPRAPSRSPSRTASTPSAACSPGAVPTPPDPPRTSG